MGIRAGQGYNPRMQKARIIVGVAILVISLSLLVWGLWPARHVRHELHVEPTQMTLPTPSSFEPNPQNAPQVGFAEQAEPKGPAGRSNPYLPLPCSSAGM